MPKFLVKMVQEVVSYRYITTDTKKEAELLVKMHSGIEDSKKEYLEPRILSVQEVQLQGNVKDINEPKAPLRIKKLSNKIIKNTTTKESYVVVKQYKERVQLGDYVQHEDDFYQLYAKTKSLIFLKNDLKKIILEATGFIKQLVLIEDYIKKEKPYECIITFNSKGGLVGRLTQFDEDVKKIIEKTNVGFEFSDAEEFWGELTEKAEKDIQDGDYYTIVRNFSKDEIEQLKKLDKYHIKVVSVLWCDLSMAARYVLEYCYDFAEKPRKFEVRIGEVLKHDSFLGGRHEYIVTEEVMDEVKKYAMYSRKINMMQTSDGYILEGVLV